MTTLTATTPAPTRAAARPGGSVTFGRLVVAEWIKLRSLRSTPWTLGLAVLSMAGIAFLIALASSSLGAEEMGLGTAAYDLATGGFFFAQLPLIVLGALAITGEYSTGQIRSTLAAAPGRVGAVLAKAVVVFLAAAVAGIVGVGLSLLVTLPFAGSLDLSYDLGSPEALRIVLGTALYLATITLLSFGIGALVRHSAAALASVLGLLLVVEMVFMMIPHAFFRTVGPYLPGVAGQRLLWSDELLESSRAAGDASFLEAWQGYGVLAAWVVVVLGAALVLLRRRDA